MLKRTLTLLLLVVGSLCMALAKDHPFTLVIDAGHGGKDPGTMTKRSKEKDICLNVALAFGRYVEKNCPDVRVIYTRKTDVFVPLRERADIANKNKADVFISIHVNAVQSKRPVAGMETYTMGMRRSDEKLSAAMRENEVVLIEKDYQQHYAGFDPRSPESYIIFEVINETNMLESVELAQMIQKNVCATANRPNKGVKQDAFLVLRETSMPACLIELGYITTPSEEAYLTNKNNVDLMGRGIYQAFVEYKRKHTTGSAAPAAEASKPAEDTPPAAPQKEQPEPKPEPKSESTQPAPAGNESATEQPASSDPVFKVQFLASNRQLKAGDAQFKGLADVDCYQENGMWKYTVGASTDYNQILRLRNEVRQKFPQAFIIAFRGNEKIDAAAAYQEYKQKHSKK